MQSWIQACVVGALALAPLSPAAGQQSAADPAGWYTGPALELTLEPKGDRWTGELSIGGRRAKLEARRQGAGLAGDFEWFGRRHRFDAVLTATGLELSSGGARLALERRSTADNPLLAVARAAGAGLAPAGAAPAAGAAARISLISGASFEAPPAWQVVWKEGAPLLLPPRAAGAPGERSLSLAELPWSGSDDLGASDNVAALGWVVGQMVPGAQQQGGPRRLAPSRRERIALSYALPGLPPENNGLCLAARCFGPSLLLVVGLGPAAELRALEPELGRLLESARPGQPGAAAGRPAPGGAGPGAMPGQPALAPGLDPALLGRWRSVETLGDVRFEGSMAIETVYDFHPDGRFVVGSAAAGGGFGFTYDGDFRVFSSGTWSTANGQLHTRNDSGEQASVTYLFHEGQLVFKLANGKYAFWVR